MSKHTSCSATLKKIVPFMG